MRDYLCLTSDEIYIFLFVYHLVQSTGMVILVRGEAIELGPQFPTAAGSFRTAGLPSLTPPQ